MSPHASTTQRQSQPAVAPGRWQQPPPQGAAQDANTDDAPLFGGALAAKQAPLRMRHLMALCAWAVAVTVLGIGVGIWAIVRMMANTVPGWYEPVIVLIGLAGIGFAIASFVTAHKRYLPWALMGASTAVLFIAIGVTSGSG